MIGNGGHFRHLIAEGCPPDAELIAIGDNHARYANDCHQVQYAKFVSHDALVYVEPELIGAGSQIMAGAVIHAGMGRHCIVGNNAVVSHDAIIHDFVFIGPGAVVCGGAVLYTGCFIGAGAVVTPNAIVPAWQLVKACERWSKQ